MYVVYHVASTQLKQTYKSAVHATNLMLKLNDRAGKKVYAANTLDHYQTKVVRMVERKNLMSGQTYLEPSNTPAFMSPAYEAYWSM